MKTKPKSTQNLNHSTQQQQWWLVVILGVFIPLTLILGNEFHVSQQITFPIVVVIGFVFSTVALWMRANVNPSDHKWWQDNSSSGWRGY